MQVSSLGENPATIMVLALSTSFWFLPDAAQRSLRSCVLKLAFDGLSMSGLDNQGFPQCQENGTHIILLCTAVSGKAPVDPQPQHLLLVFILLSSIPKS